MNPNQKPPPQQQPELPPLKALKVVLHGHVPYPAKGDKSGNEKTYFSAKEATGDPGWDLTVDWKKRVVFFERPGGSVPRGFIPFEAFFYAVTDFGD